MVLEKFKYIFNFALLLTILINISQRKLPRSSNKIRAVLLWATDLLFLYILLILIESFSWPEWLEFVAIAAAAIPPIVLRRLFWPFTLHCRKCGKPLRVDSIIGRDENLCDDCYWEKYPDERPRVRQRALTNEEYEELFKGANRVDEIPWDEWSATEPCVLTYLIHEGRVLLIEKKRGMGTGYYNAPGGHIELEETKFEAAIRETKEETGLEVSNLKEMGTLRFQFKDGIRMVGYVFTASAYSGEMIDECEETRPFWCDIASLDYSKMWEDDREWLPMLLRGEHFEGYFIFDDKKLIDSKVIKIDE